MGTATTYRIESDKGAAIAMRQAVRSMTRLHRQQDKLPSSTEVKEYLRLVLDEDRW